MSLPSLTPHQAAIFGLVARKSTSFAGPVHERFVGSHGACWRLVRKGYLDAQEQTGPRGGRSWSYTVTPEGRASSAFSKALADLETIRAANAAKWGS